MPLPNVSAKILAKVIEFCKFHVEANKKTEDGKPGRTEDEVKVFDNDFVKVDQAMLFELILVRADMECLSYVQPSVRVLLVSCVLAEGSCSDLGPSWLG